MSTVAFDTLKFVKTLEAELQVLKWMSGLIMGGMIALVMKTFF